MEESEISQADSAFTQDSLSVVSLLPAEPPGNVHPYSNFDVSHLVTLLSELEISALNVNMFNMEIGIGFGGESVNVSLNKFQQFGSPEVVSVVKQYAPLDKSKHFEHTIDSAFREICTMKHPRLSKHPNILNLLGVSDCRHKLGGTSFSFAVVTEFAELGSLTGYLQNKLNWTTKSQLIHDCREGLEALHSCDIVHNDVKADNILLFPVIDSVGKHMPKLLISGTRCYYQVHRHNEKKRVRYGMHHPKHITRRRSSTHFEIGTHSD